MRTRILIPLTVVMLLAAIAVIVPLFDSMAHDRTSQLVLSRAAALDRLQLSATRAIDADIADGFQRQAESHHRVFGEAVVVVDSDGEVFARIGDIDIADPDVAIVAQRALRNLPTNTLPALSFRRSDDLYLATPLLTDADFVGGAVILAVNTDAAVSDLQHRAVVLAAVGLVAVAVLGVISWAVTRWILRPIDQLETAVGRLAGGDHQTGITESGPPELRRLARRFDAMARTVTTSLSQQRQLVADSSHLLRNPLAGLRLRVDSLAIQLDSPDGATDARQTLAAVECDLDRLERLVADLLTLAEATERAGADVEEGEPARTETATLLSELESRWQHRLQLRTIALRTTATTSVAVPIERSVIDDMVDTLIDNASRYAGERSTITVAVERGVPGITIAVSDDGPGLQPDEFELAQQRFWRSARHRDTEGTGLGLAIVDQLARAYGGGLELTAAAEGGLRAAIVVPDNSGTSA